MAKKTPPHPGPRCESVGPKTFEKLTRLQMQEEKMRIRALHKVSRELKIIDARNSLRHFIEYMMPDPNIPEDADQSQFKCSMHHDLLIELVEKVEEGTCLRAAVSVAPQHGKTTIMGLYGIAYMLARKPTLNIIFGTYSEDRAMRVGEQVRSIMTSDRFHDVFPKSELRAGSRSKDFLGTREGGGVLFRGRGSATTGNPCDIFIIDDPIKDNAEANSPAVRDQVWEWYCAVVFSRAHALTRILVVHTRWTEDDLIGRLCDPNHSDYDPDSAAKWTYINLPAIIEDKDLANALNLEVGQPLWKERFSLALLNEAKKQNPETFSALYMGKPVPDEGNFFKKEMVVEYRRDQLPETLRYYATSDHALKAKNVSDFTVLLIWGVDRVGNIWLVDCVWDKLEPLACVEAMCDLMVKYKPITWWVGRDHITGALGPFLKKRMQERKIYNTFVQDVSERGGDKQIKAQAIRGRMAQGMVKFPKEAPWFARAKQEVLKFDKAGHDDFVDALSVIGRVLDTLYGANPIEKTTGDGYPKPGTLAWVRYAADQDKKLNAIRKGLQGW